MIYSLKGKRFNAWIVISEPTMDFRPSSLCRCECGTEKIVEHYNLRSGRSKSCRECSAKNAWLGKTPHRKSNTKVYRAWQSMKTRCYNSNHKKNYEYHGHYGITVYPDWIDNFEVFYAYVGDPPSPQHSLGRIDPLGNYEPGNVGWQTPAEQSRNCVPRVNREILVKLRNS